MIRIYKEASVQPVYYRPDMLPRIRTKACGAGASRGAATHGWRAAYPGRSVSARRWRWQAAEGGLPRCWHHMSAAKSRDPDAEKRLAKEAVKHGVSVRHQAPGSNLCAFHRGVVAFPFGVV